MKTKNLTVTVFFFLFLTKSFSQITQTIRGKVIEKETQSEIVGAEVYLTTDTTKKTGTTTDVNGDFRLDNVEIGRHSLKISFIGYSDVYLSNIIVDAGKEVILNIYTDRGKIILETLLKLDSPTHPLVKLYNVNLPIRKGDWVGLYFGTRPYEDEPTVVRIDILDSNYNPLHTTIFLSRQAYLDALRESGIDENNIITYF